MSVTMLEERPPLCRFEVRAIEDRNATIEAGHFVGKDVIFALITPRGSKDVHEEVAEDWLRKLAQEVKEERFKAEWMQQYHQLYTMYKAGIEAPVNGMSLRNWPGITPSQLRTCHAIHLHAVEDLAAANEEAVAAIGMGGRALREKARQYLAAAAGPGAASAQIVAQNEQIKGLTARNEVLESQVRALIAKVGGIDQPVAEAPPSNVAPIKASDILPDPEPITKPALRKL